MKIERLMLHTFATEGYFDFARLFLEALKLQYGGRVHVRLDAWNFSQERIEQLQKTYQNLDLRNQVRSYQEVADLLHTDMDTLLAWKREVECGETTDKNYLFKIFISVNQRYRSMQEVILEAGQAGYEYLIHSDVDLYIRTRFLESLLQIIDQHDLCLYLRPKQAYQRKVVGGFLCFNLNAAIDKFAAQWMQEIDKVPFLERWKGFGQSALWNAIQNSDDLKVGDLNLLPGSPKRSKKFEKDADIWLGSNSKFPVLQGLYCRMNNFFTPWQSKDSQTLPIKPFFNYMSRKRCWKDLKRKRSEY